MTKILSLEEGVQEVITRIKAVEEKPILVAIYGWPNSGKSYLISQVGNYFKDNGLLMAKFSGAASPYTFERMSWPVRDEMLYLFHCAWERKTYFPAWTRDEDPDVLAERIAGKKVHLNTAIFNPGMYEIPEGDYDFIISNPNSVKKNLPSRSRK